MPATLRSHLQRAINRLLAPAGLHLTRRDRVFDLDGLLAHARQRGFSPVTVIDIGASDGIWSLRARRHFLEARFFLFEPLSARRPALEAPRDRHGFEFVAAVAGAQPEVTAFSIDPALDGSCVAAPSEPFTREVPVETIDGAVTSRSLAGPFLLKLDTHAYEIPVLTGASDVLAHTQLLIIEAYNFNLSPGCLRFHELCAWLDGRGFRCCDLADPIAPLRRWCVLADGPRIRARQQSLLFVESIRVIRRYPARSSTSSKDKKPCRATRSA